MQATGARPQAQVLERGSILFLYRPKSGVDRVQGAPDLERVYFALLPDDQEEHKSRIYNLPRRSFPVLVPGRAAPLERAWAVAQEVEADPRVAVDNLQEEATAARAPGQRTRPWVRVAGEGRYVIARHGADTHLAYALDRPERPGEVQEALHLAPRGNFLVWVQAPTAPSEVRFHGRPHYPPRLESRLIEEQVPVDPSDFLDYRHTQVLLLAADSDVEQELGLRLRPGVQNRAQRQALQILHKEERRAAQEGVAMLEPLKEGAWA